LKEYISGMLRGKEEDYFTVTPFKNIRGGAASDIRAMIFKSE
jgi:hypothetical protein